MPEEVSREKFEQFMKRLQEIESNYTQEIKKILQQVDEDKLKKLKEELGVI